MLSTTSSRPARAARAESLRRVIPLLTNADDTETVTAASLDTGGTVELLSAQIAELVRQRQTLRASFAGRDELERNRREIAHLQWQLAHALIARHVPNSA